MTSQLTMLLKTPRLLLNILYDYLPRIKLSTCDSDAQTRRRQISQPTLIHTSQDPDFTMCHSTYYTYKECIHTTPYHPFPEHESFAQTRRAPLPPPRDAKPRKTPRRPNNGPPLPPPPPGYPDPRPFQYVTPDSESDDDQDNTTPPAPPPKDTAPSISPARTRTSSTRTRTSFPTTPSKRTSPVTAKLSSIFTTTSSSSDASLFASISSSPPKQDDEGITTDPVTGAAIAKCWFKPYHPAKHCPSGLTRREFQLPGKCKRCEGRDETLLKLEGPDGRVFKCSEKERTWLENMAALEMKERLGLPDLMGGAEWI